MIFTLRFVLGTIKDLEKEGVHLTQSSELDFNFYLKNETTCIDYVVVKRDVKTGNLYYSIKNYELSSTPEIIRKHTKKILVQKPIKCCSAQSGTYLDPEDKDNHCEIIEDDNGTFLLLAEGSKAHGISAFVQDIYDRKFLPLKDGQEKSVDIYKMEELLGQAKASLNNLESELKRVQEEKLELKDELKSALEKIQKKEKEITVALENQGAFIQRIEYLRKGNDEIYKNLCDAKNNINKIECSIITKAIEEALTQLSMIKFPFLKLSTATKIVRQIHKTIINTRE
uniref:Uncharacterized protein n=1 Tax=candidate division CPR3 bacterium TaxID=2268181 RepID=A0A7C4R6G8_UNCC3